MSAAPPPGTDEAPGSEPIPAPPAPADVPSRPTGAGAGEPDGRGRQRRYGGMPPNAPDRHVDGPRSSGGHHRTVSDPRLAIVSADRRWRRLIN